MKPSEEIRQTLRERLCYSWEDDTESGPKAMEYVKEILNWLDEHYQPEDACKITHPTGYQCIGGCGTYKKPS